MVGPASNGMLTTNIQITAKVNPDATPSPVPTRPPSQASNILDVSPLSPPAPIRPKAKLTSGATTTTTGSLKPTAPKSSGSTIANGKKTPASSVVGRATRERPASLIGTPARQPNAPFSQPASPMNPPSASLRRARSPQPPRGASPVSRTTRPIKSPDPHQDRRFMSPSPSHQRRVLAPSPASGSGSTLSRRATSPSVRPTRKRESPVPVPPLTIPRRGASPTRQGPFNNPRSLKTSTHRRIASASSALSGSSVGPSANPEPTKPRVPQSLSAITLDAPPPFSAVPKSPPRSAQPDLGSPSPPPSLPPLPLSEPSPPEPSIESQDDDSSSASIEQSEEESQSSTPPSATPPIQSMPLVMSSAPVTPSHIQITPAPDLIPSSTTLLVQDPPLITSSAPVTPSHTQTAPPPPPPSRPRTSSVSFAPQPPNNLLSNLASGMRITAKVSPATLAAATASARSSSGGSTISGIAPSMISGVSSIRVGANSRILSPPPDRRIPFVGLNLQGSTFPVPPIGSPPASIVSSMSSASRHSRSASYTHSRSGSFTHGRSGSLSHGRSGSFADGTRTPTDVGLRPRLSSSGASALGIAIEDEGGGGGGGGVERDDSGIDMFEADDGEERHGQNEARSNRKIADLEISNKSLLAINAMLEATKERQAKEIRDLRRKLRESRLVLPPKTFAALEESDPLKDSGSSSGSSENGNDTDGDVTQIQADETFDRVRQMLDQMMDGAKTALETGTVKLSEKASGGPSIRVLNKMDVHGEEGDEEEDEEEEDEEEEESEESESEESEADDDSAMGDLSSIDGVSPMEEHPPIRVGANAKIIESTPTGTTLSKFGSITSSLSIPRWR
ncbi:cytochrome P450 family protein [Ceratobasidium sp. AG-Ba]|nr:cytochrome P450 family protein [Ceratobasidium sp. AG-Ba]